MMDLLTLITVGVLTGLAASLLIGYSLGALSNSISGVAGALYWGNYLSTMFDLSATAGRVAGGLLGAALILAVFNAYEYFSHKKHHLL
jgi:uncharacterized membrane protein YeaQ/YmgE (transglycosylase-associated protein family)